MFIPDPDLEFLPIPDAGSRGKKDTGSRIRNTGICMYRLQTTSGLFLAKKAAKKHAILGEYLSGTVEANPAFYQWLPPPPSPQEPGNCDPAYDAQAYFRYLSLL
jgi:hypothetical protein